MNRRVQVKFKNKPRKSSKEYGDLATEEHSLARIRLGQCPPKPTALLSRRS